jgi:hypothetical protein
VDLTGAVFANRVNLYWIVAFREVDPQNVARSRRRCDPTMTSKLDQRLSAMAATRLIDGITKETAGAATALMRRVILSTLLSLQVD